MKESATSCSASGCCSATSVERVLPKSADDLKASSIKEIPRALVSLRRLGKKHLEDVGQPVERNMFEPTQVGPPRRSHQQATVEALACPFAHQHKWCPVGGMRLVRRALGDQLCHGTAQCLG